MKSRYLYCASTRFTASRRSEEHTSELQSRVDLVCRLLLEKKKKKNKEAKHNSNARTRTATISGAMEGTNCNRSKNQERTEATKERKRTDGRRQLQSVRNDQ